MEIQVAGQDPAGLDPQELGPRGTAHAVHPERSRSNQLIIGQAVADRGAGVVPLSSCEGPESSPLSHRSFGELGVATFLFGWGLLIRLGSGGGPVRPGPRAPTWVLSREPYNQLSKFVIDRRPSGSVRIGPLPCDETAMPGRQRGCHDAVSACLAGQRPRQGGQDRTISPRGTRGANLAAKDRDFVA
jgi:hypothetical protein